MLNTKCEQKNKTKDTVRLKTFDEDAKGSKIRESCGFSIHAPVVAKTSGVVETNSISLTLSPYFLFITFADVQ